MNSSLNILLLEDSAADADLLKWHLKKEGVSFVCRRVWDRESFLTQIADTETDLVIADYNLPQFNGVEAFRLLKGMKKNIPFILVTGSISEQLVIECTKDGIDDYLMKGNLLRLSRAVENVLNKKRIERLHSELLAVHGELKASINYAKMIQESMLPKAEMLSEVYKQSFIYFQPKDVLSGDFYWFKKSDGKFYIAAADCTGHGIPGSLLSIMGFNMLHMLTHKDEITVPSRIMNKLIEQFRKITLNSGSKMKDGMDIALCTVDLLNKRMIYAGANRPIYILSQNILHEYKPDKIAIDGMKAEAPGFTDHLIQLQGGDRVFMFSDGVADQFHHETNKKLLMKRIKDQLLFTAVLDFNEQKEALINFFEKWRGSGEQTDDVLMIGFEVD